MDGNLFAGNRINFQKGEVSVDKKENYSQIAAIRNK
jgi:hypothetical protein